MLVVIVIIIHCYHYLRLSTVEISQSMTLLSVRLVVPMTVLLVPTRRPLTVLIKILLLKWGHLLILFRVGVEVGSLRRDELFKRGESVVGPLGIIHVDGRLTKHIRLVGSVNRYEQSEVVILTLKWVTHLRGSSAILRLLILVKVLI